MTSISPQNLLTGKWIWHQGYREVDHLQ